MAFSLPVVVGGTAPVGGADGCCEIGYGGTEALDAYGLLAKDKQMK